MALTDTQIQSLKADIDANSGPGGDFENIPDTPDGDFAMADLYNALAVPDFWVFKRDVKVDDIISGIDWVEYELLTDAERDGLNLLLRNGTYNPEPNNARVALNTLLTGAGNTKTGILGVSTQLATRGEKVFAEDATGSPGGGNGSAANASARRGFAGNLSRFDIRAARDLPS